METSTVDGTGAAAVATGAMGRTPRRQRLRWLRAAGRAKPQSAQAQQLEELEVELALLREEHARLRMTRQRARDRPVHERVRELLPLQEQDAAGDADPWELMTDCLLLRNGLIDACREIELSMRQTRQRLEALAPGQQRERERSAPDTLGRPTAREDLESAA